MPKKKPIIFFLLTSFLALIGVMALLFATRWGIGISPDSVSYISAARNLLNGHGLSVLSITLLSNRGGLTPMIDWPPLFPTTLAALGFFNIDLIDAARCLNVFLFGANILLVGIIIRHYIRSFWIPIFGSFLMLTSIDMYFIHSMAWTEPMFIFFGFLGLFLLAKYIENSKLLFFIASSGAIALAFLTRYPGLALVVTGIVSICLFGRKKIYERIADSINFAIISCLPIGWWFIRNLFLADSLTGRKAVFHPITIDHIKAALFVLSRWLSPDEASGFILLIIFGSLLILSILELRKRNGLDKESSSKQHFGKLPYLLTAFIFIYGLFLVISISFFDAYVLLMSYDRILSPIYVTGLILSLLLAEKIWGSLKENPFLQIVFCIVCVVFAISYLVRGTLWIIGNSKDGHGYASRTWQNSEIIEEVRTFPPEITIFTNGADAIYFLTGRTVSSIPTKVSSFSIQANYNYLREMADMGEKLRNKGVLVYFNTIGRWYLPSEEELKAQLPLFLIKEAADGTIYKARSY